MAKAKAKEEPVEALETEIEDVPVEEVAEGDEQGTFDFIEDMGFDEDEEEGAPVEEEAEPEPEEEPAAEAPEPDPKDTKDEKEKEEAPAQATPPQSEEKEQPSTSDQDLNVQFEEFFNKSADALAEHVYGLSEEEKKLLDEEPSKVIPKLAGRLHMQVLTAALTQAANLMPHFVSQTQKQNTREAELESKFFGAFPQLRDHYDDVKRIATAYRQAYPDLSSDDLIQEVGTSASVRLRIPLPGQEARTLSEPEAAKPPTPTTVRSSGAPPTPPATKTWLEEIFTEED